jgi:hypothetical protein
MSNESNNALPRHLVSAFGAVAASTMMLGIAAAPVRAEPVGTPADAWVDRIEASLRSNIRPMAFVPVSIRREKAAIVLARFDGEGRLASLSLGQETGSPALDAEAVRAAGQTRIPRLPRTMRGNTRVVPIEVYFVPPEQHRARVAVRRASQQLAARAARTGVPTGRT